MPGPLPARLALAARLVRAEGLRSILERWRERQSEITRRRRYEERTLEGASALLGAGETLNVLPFPFRSGLGGVPIALAARLDARARAAPGRLAEPRSAGLATRDRASGPLRRRGSRRRELAVAHAATDGHRRGDRPDRGRGAADPGSASREPRRLAAVRLRRRSEAGFASLRGAPRALVLSAHDFALFCRRPNLLEEPSGRFCGFSRDAHRCLRCLTVDDPGATFAETAERRESASSLLGSAAAIVHVSDFSRRSHLDLFPGLDPGRIIQPGSFRRDHSGARARARADSPRAALAAASHRVRRSGCRSQGAARFRRRGRDPASRSAGGALVGARRRDSGEPGCGPRRAV